MVTRKDVQVGAHGVLTPSTGGRMTFEVTLSAEAVAHLRRVRHWLDRERNPIVDMAADAVQDALVELCNKARTDSAGLARKHFERSE